MAYTHTQYEVQFTSTAGAVEFSATASGQLSDWSPGYMQHIIRACAIIPTTTGGDYTGAAWAFQRIGLASGATASDIAQINAVASDKPGVVLYKHGLNIVVSPGQKVTFGVRTKATNAGSTRARAVLFVEPTWENPANQTTNMRSTT